jgi:transposase
VDTDRDFVGDACKAIASRVRGSVAQVPFDATPHGWAGSNLLAMLLFEKFGQHQPLNR